MVSECVQGPSLDQLIRREGPRSPDSLVRLAIATAAALNGIHQAGIVHRDFKPANVLLAPDGPRVIDFGIACAVGRLTTSGGAKGTRPSCRPNRSKAVRQVRPRTSSAGARRCTSRRPVAQPSTVRPSGPSRTRSSTPTQTFAWFHRLFASSSSRPCSSPRMNARRHHNYSYCCHDRNACIRSSQPLLFLYVRCKGAVMRTLRAGRAIHLLDIENLTASPSPTATEIADTMSDYLCRVRLAPWTSSSSGSTPDHWPRWAA
ncbi:hypothetical protein E1267_26890 [Nonomuraea longispora]|uniref:Protein kinase domain-containing protein n=1 Tax=Nonomuraea longispora TaxID=1848320 RepID=A0A4R4N3F9_9ACTN|nr:hypothetical protein E1267_26890 [Nonomuraea longispora]